MRYGLLGRNTGLMVSQIALGTGRLGMSRAGRSDPNTARQLLLAFSEAGGTLLDTSSAYLLGAAETMIGEFLAEAGRDRFIIASKYGRTAQSAPPAALVGCHRAAMRADVEGSLKRLGTDRLDIYFPHFDDGVTPIEEIMAGLNDLVRSGKVVHLGMSNFPAWRIASAAMLAELRGLAPVVVVQLRYNLVDREAEREHLPLARARGLGVMGYSPLAGGALMARIRARSDGGGSDDALIDALATIAQELHCEPAAVALSWLEAKGILAVIGPRDVGQLAASLTGAELQLSDTQHIALDEASRPALGHPYDLLSEVRARAGIVGPDAGSIL